MCTQPRRIAAMAVAARTAAEMGSTLGEEVGYAIRFDSKCNNNTAIKYCTDGLLLRETMQDPLLSKYSVIIVDEAHERSLYTDILLGLLKKIHRRRPDLRVIIASASLDAQELKDFFETHQKLGSSPAQPLEGESACVLSITGRTHPVDVLYLEEPCSDYVRSAVTTCLEIHQSLEEWGDILVSKCKSVTVNTIMSNFANVMAMNSLFRCSFLGLKTSKEQLTSSSHSSSLGTPPLQVRCSTDRALSC